jgi:hypothetical protein
MPVSVSYMLICDDVRVENTGKLIDIRVPKFPFVFSSLTFLQAMMIDVAGRYHFHGRINHRESETEVASFEGAMEVGSPGSGFVPVRFGNLELAKEGRYIFTLNVNGQVEPIIKTFDVLPHPSKESGS